MGILTDFIIAESGSGPAIGESQASGAWPAMQAKRIDTVKLAALHCTIAQTPYRDEIQKSFQLVGGHQDDGPWVFEFPPSILIAIAHIDPNELLDIAEKWAQTKELKSERWSADDACSFIIALSTHAKNALQQGKSMYLWMSL